MQRILQSDVVFVLSDRVIDPKSHANRCVLRDSDDRNRNLVIPIEASPKRRAIDDTRVQNPQVWLPAMLRDLNRCYRGLKFAEVAETLVRDSLEEVDSPWLTDYLMSSLVATMGILGCERTEPVRVDTTERRRFQKESELLLQLCLEHDCDRVIVGHAQQETMNQKLFHRNSIELVTQYWDPPPGVERRDSVLDIIARHSIENIMGILGQGRKPRSPVGLPGSQPG